MLVLHHGVALADRALEPDAWHLDIPRSFRQDRNAAGLKRMDTVGPQIITANALLVWFVWGIFMAMGWALGSWIMSMLIGFVPYRGPVVPPRA